MTKFYNARPLVPKLNTHLATRNLFKFYLTHGVIFKEKGIFGANARSKIKLQLAVEV